MERNNGSRSGNTKHGLSDMAIEEVSATMAQVMKHLDAAYALLEDAHVLDAGQTQVAVRLRGAPEVAALSGIIQFTAVHPDYFTSLAAQVDAKSALVFESEVLATRLQNAQAMSPVANRAQEVAKRLSGCVLYTTQLVKPVVLKAYAMSRSMAHGVSRGDLLFAARDYYRNAAVSAAKTRASKKDAAANDNEPTQSQASSAAVAPPGVAKGGTE